MPVVGFWMFPGSFELAFHLEEGTGDGEEMLGTERE